MLQTKFSLLLNDNSKLKSALDETRNVLEMSRTNFQQRLEHMESEELAQQKRLGNEMMQLEEQLTQVRKENELLRIEYEQNVAANEQTGPINKEMRSLITTLQTKNKLLQSDNTRTKKRVEEMQQDLDKAKKQISQLQAQLQQQQQIKKESSASSEVKAEPMQVDLGSQKQACSSSESSNDVKQSNSGSETETDEKIKKLESKDSIIKDLKEQNKKLQENQKDMKNIIEIYSKSNKQQSPPSNSSNNNNNNSSSSSGKHKSELDEARMEIKRLKECIDKMKSATSSSSKVIIPTQQIPANSSSPSTHHAHHDEHASTPTSNSTPTSSSSSSNPSVNEHIKKIKTLEENVRELHKSLNNKKQEEVALLNDMEITGQAFEDMQVNFIKKKSISFQVFF